jgi:hypothetical protein
MVYGRGMFIRRTAIKSRETGEPYYTYRLVESVRTSTSVRQHTVLNLGCRRRRETGPKQPT